MIKRHLESTAITSGPYHHFFGYYDKEQWDPSGRFLLAHQVDFMDRSPGPEDQARIGIIDTCGCGRFQALAATKAWCWQQGSMLQWLPGTDAQIIYNDRIGDRFVSVIMDIRGVRRQVLPRPVYTVRKDGRRALSLNFSRIAVGRPGYGYNGLRDPWRHEFCPVDDGVYDMDLRSGDHRLILSVADVADRHGDPSMQGRMQWLNHLLYNPSGTRFTALHYWPTSDKRSFPTKLLTANTDGSDLFVSSVQNPSHFMWLNDRQILVWATTERHGAAYYLLEDRTDDKTPVDKKTLTKDGHCSMSPQGRWLLTDEYLDHSRSRPLYLYDMQEARLFEIGRFHSPFGFRGELRCDLHPRWNRDGRMVCFDSVHDGSRQMYVMDVSDVVA